MAGEEEPTNVSLIVCPDWCFDSRTTELLESYRQRYEAIHGPTDRKCIYCTQLPPLEQDRLMRHSMNHYVARMPPYLRAFLRDFLKEQRFPLDDFNAPGIGLAMALLRHGRGNHTDRGR